MSDAEKMARALARLYTARKARREASAAMRRYLAKAWGEADPDEDGPGYRDPKAHTFGCCGLGHTCDGDVYYGDAVPILCPVCLGSAPLHDDQVKASRAAGQALRVAQAIGRRIAESAPPTTTPKATP